jgi:hypothetical protein
MPVRRQIRSLKCRRFTHPNHVPMQYCFINFHRAPGADSGLETFSELMNIINLPMFAGRQVAFSGP